MRDLDKRGLMSGDFLLVSGDVVSNLPLESALARHRKRREKDKNAIMTMILREAGAGHRTNSRERKPVFVIEPETERCLHYAELSRGKQHDRSIKLDPQVLTAHSQLEVRGDLIDCYIDICTPDVLSLWSDNFDYQSVRQSFLSEVLKDFELTGKTIHTYVVSDHYAARVRSLRAYDAVTKDVLNRWTYPLCPDSNLMKDQSYRFERGKIYEEEGVTLARTSVVKTRSVLGQDTSIAEGSIISRSVLGRRCRIGKDVTIDDSYVWDDVSIGDGSVVQQSIIADRVWIGQNCRIEPGALISFGVRIADCTTVPGTSRITLTTQKAQSNSTMANGTDGEKREGYFQPTDLDEDDSDASSIISSSLPYRNPSVSISSDSVSTLNSEASDFEPFHPGSRRSSVISDPSEDTAKTHDFHAEATASVLDGIQKGDLSENILLELNSYRMSVDANQHEVRRAVVVAIMKRILGLVSGDDSLGVARRGPQDAVKEVFGKFRTLVERTIYDKSKGQKDDQVDFLLLVQKEVIGRPLGEYLMLFVATEAYDLEIVEEDGVLQWWDDSRSEDRDMGKVRLLTEKLISFLKEAEEGSEESDADEE